MENLVAVISLNEIALAAFQQHVFWGSLLVALAIFGFGPWSFDRCLAPGGTRNISQTDL